MKLEQLLTHQQEIFREVGKLLVEKNLELQLVQCEDWRLGFKHVENDWGLINLNITLYEFPRSVRILKNTFSSAGKVSLSHPNATKEILQIVERLAEDMKEWRPAISLFDLNKKEN